MYDIQSKYKNAGKEIELKDKAEKSMGYTITRLMMLKDKEFREEFKSHLGTKK